MSDTQAWADATTGKVHIGAEADGETIGDTGLTWDSQAQTVAEFTAEFTRAADELLAETGWTRSREWAETALPGFSAPVSKSS